MRSGVVMTRRLLLCTDLDRTLLPNGEQPESKRARELFATLVARQEVSLVYVTGRDRKLVEQAINNYRIPVPDFVIADVGSTIFEIRQDGAWRHWQKWEDEISADWAGRKHGDLKALFRGIPLLRLQETRKQNTHKLSYYVPLHGDRHLLEAQMNARLQKEGINATLVWSVDEPAAVGLLDVVPAGATKRHAIEFLMQQNGYSIDNTLFAGDSGNDLPVMASAIRSVLVANATSSVRASAGEAAALAGTESALYVAQGGVLGMNGNYSAGILEGVLHYYPWCRQWLEESIDG